MGRNAVSGLPPLQCVGRCGLVLAAAAWVSLRLHLGPCLIAWAAAFGLLEAGLSTAAARRRGEGWDGALIVGQFLVSGLAVFVPAPLGLGSAAPNQGLDPPVILESPFFLLLICLVATHVSASRPWRTVAAGSGLIIVWIGGLAAGLVRPWVLTRNRIHLPPHVTVLDILRITHAPNYLNLDFWKFDLAVAVAVALVLGLAASRLGQLARAAAERQARRAALGAHFAPSLLDAVLVSNALTPAPRQVAILDCDLVGFTFIAEGRPAADVADILRAYRAAFEASVFAHGGAIVSYAGDGAVALFGLDRPTGFTTQAVQAAIALNDRWETDRGVCRGPAAAAGVDIGEAVVGLDGDGRGAALVVVGDPLSGAAKLQRLCRPARAFLLVSPAVATEVHDAVSLRPLEVGGVHAFTVASSGV